jgi:hypothetical protein
MTSETEAWTLTWLFLIAIGFSVIGLQLTDGLGDVAGIYVGAIPFGMWLLYKGYRTLTAGEPFPGGW